MLAFELNIPTPGFSIYIELVLISILFYSFMLSYFFHLMEFENSLQLLLTLIIHVLSFYLKEIAVHFG